MAVERVLQRQPAAPRIAEEVHPLQPERLSHRRHLCDRPLNGPETRVVRTIRSAAAELVVEDHHAFIGQVGQGVDVVVRHARPAMQAQERDAALANGLVPDPASWNLDRAFVGGARPRCGRHWDQVLVRVTHRTVMYTTPSAR